MFVSQMNFGLIFRKRSVNLMIAVSIRSVAATLAYDTMSYYTGNITNTPEVKDPGELCLFWIVLTVPVFFL